MRAFKRAALSLAALWCCAGAAMAVNTDGALQLDSFTGLPAAYQESAQSSLIRVTTGADYDMATGSFLVYQNRATDSYIYSNVLPSMQVTEPVQITGELTQSCQLLRDGVPVEAADLNSIKEPGQYLLSMGDPQTPGTVTMPFTILGEETNLLESFSPPTGFYITGFTLDGRETEFTMDHASMTVDGDYAVSYRCAATGIGYTLAVGVDHTPPVLALAGVVDGVSSGEVSLADLEEGAAIQIFCNDKLVETTDTLTQQGVYKLLVTDKAGNITSYQFTVPIYFNRNSLVFFGMILLGLGALIAYLWHSKTHLRVR